ncbi:MAG TPA: hypothetical protein VGJ15_06825 [Pirellulales bacterium]|jgi:hypothetical protein
MNEIPQKTIEWRTEFADFLRRLAAGTFTSTEWKRLIVTQYPDEFLEDIRRQVVRLNIQRDGGKEWSDSEIAALQTLSRELKKSVIPS